MFLCHLSLEEPDIAPPHNFEFQLNHYVFPPERRYGDCLVEVVCLSPGVVVLVEIRSRGTLWHPKLDLSVYSHLRLTDVQACRVAESISWRLSLQEDLQPFYRLIQADPVMQAAIGKQPGAKDKRTATMFEALVDAVCAQNLPFQRLYLIMDKLTRRFGEPVDGLRSIYTFPAAECLAQVSEEALRACGVGYRARYIKAIGQVVASREANLEKTVLLPVEEARVQLCSLPGVGQYTADLTLVIGAGRRNVFPLDRFIREILWHFYFDGRHAIDEELRSFAQRQWGDYQGLATFYLATNVHEWAETLGRPFRLKSAAKGTP